jgi:hypothetical protein
VSGHGGPFHPGDSEPASIGGQGPHIGEPLPEAVQDAAIDELLHRVQALQQRRGEILHGLDALANRVAAYEANHPNL